MPPKKATKTKFRNAASALESLINKGSDLAGADANAVNDRMGHAAKCKLASEKLSQKLSTFLSLKSGLHGGSKLTEDEVKDFENLRDRAGICMQALGEAIKEFDEPNPETDDDSNDGKSVELNTQLPGAVQITDNQSSCGPPADLASADLSKFSPEQILELRRMELELQKVLLEQTRAKSAADLTRPAIPASPGDYLPPNSTSAVMTKLPKLTLKEFDGDILKWDEFWDPFCASIHRNTHLSDVDKFTYLKGLLKGAAENSIKGLKVVSANYSTAIDLLQARFARKCDIIDAHYSALRELPATFDNTGKLRQFFDAVEHHIRSLETLGEDPEQRVFLNLIRSKLPASIREKLDETLSGHDWTVSLLRERLLKLIERRELIQREIPEEAEPSPDQVRLSTTDSLLVKAQGQRANKGSWGQSKKGKPHQYSQRQPPERYCVMCSDKSHWTNDCPIYSTLSERRQKLRGRCFNCLGSDHNARKCNSRKACYFCRQVKSHHSCLCPSKFQKGEQIYSVIAGTGEHSRVPPVPTTVAHPPSTIPPHGVAFVSSGASGQNYPQAQVPTSQFMSTAQKVPLQTAVALIENPISKRQVRTRILLDTGSQKSYISGKLSRDLGLVPIGQETLHVNTFASQQPKVLNTAIVSLGLNLQFGDYLTIRANEIERITTGTHYIPASFVQQPDSELWMDKLADDINADHPMPIDILIGNDYYWDIVTAKKLELQPGLYLIWTKLGWVFGGRLPSGDPHSGETTLLSSFLTMTDRNFTPHGAFSVPDLEMQPKLHSDIKTLWDLETLGITEKAEVSDDQQVLERFRDTVTFKGGRYEVALPWNGDQYLLPDNYKLALGRLKSLVSRLSDKPEILQRYNDIIQEQLSKGVIEKVCEGMPEGEVIHYIPHHAVVTPQKSTTKVHIVYDGSAKTRSTYPSINDCLYRGPVILEDLVALLIRFRLNQFAIVADIEKAFLQVQIRPSDRDAARFLWLKDPSKSCLKDNVLVLCFATVLFGLICSPFLLAATVDLHAEKCGGPIADIVRDNIYVDNVIVSVTSHCEAVQFYDLAKQIFASASMNLREWATNDRQLMDYIPPADKVPSNPIKVLGLFWDYFADQLYISLPPNKFTVECQTKRAILSSLSGIYDPLGFFSPSLLEAKLLIQKLWNDGYDWDTNLPSSIVSQWSQIAMELQSIPETKFPRCIGLSEATTIQLHCFTDASAYAYGAAVYLRVCNASELLSNLIFAKSRVGPKRALTIPRLELLAVLIGIRSLSFCAQAIKLSAPKLYLWTDSQCVLHWLSSIKSVSRFVDNRIKEIRSVKGVNFAYVSTLENPADLVSRGVSKRVLDDSLCWWYGPEWLAKAEESWPKHSAPSISPDKMDILLDKKSSTAPVHQFQVLAEEPRLLRVTIFGINEQRYSSLKKLYRVTAYVLRFLHNIRAKSLKYQGALSLHEIEAAKITWDRLIQSRCFSDVQNACLKGERHQLVRQLGLKLHSDGLIRCHGRMSNAELLDSALFPKLLPKSEHYTYLIILQNHQKLFHAGTAHTLSETRNEYWIVHGRSVVNSVLQKCPVCTKWEGKPFRAPDMPAFPRSRVAQDSPFAFTGLDYFGPMYVKSGRQTKKIWVCIFTCLVVRAIHLELVWDMTSEQFLLALQRFVARRGAPKQVISDNASTFKLAAKVLGDLAEQADAQKVLDYCQSQGIEWKFITERAPWMGGFYERLISLVKRSLRKSIGSLCLTYDQLSTILCQVEATVNSRPLVYLDINPSVTIRPADFLCLNSKPLLPLNAETDVNIEYQIRGGSADILLDNWRKGQSHLDAFWKLWRREYLTSLRERYQMGLRQSKSAVCAHPKKGDVVLVYDDLPRSRWKTAVIEDVHEDSNGIARSATVRIPNGTFLKRAIKMLYPLEVKSPEE